MSSNREQACDPRSMERGDGEPSLRQMMTLWLPLAASIVMMVLEPSTINFGLGRTTNPDLALAAYGVAFSLALLVEAPIIMLLDASVARSTDGERFRLLRMLTVGLGLAVTAIGLLVSLTPLYGLLVERLMSIPPDVAERARPTLQILSFWPLPIAWRRTHQGLLIRNGRTGVITLATGVRLVSLAGALFTGLRLEPGRGAIVAGLSMLLSVTVEAAVITLAARPVLRSESYRRNRTRLSDPRTGLHDLWRFYRPLLMTTVLRQSIRPMLNAGIAMALLARASLAAWPVTWGFTILVSGPAWSLQQLTTAAAEDQASYRRVRSFALTLSSCFALLLAAVALTPLYGVVMGGVYNLSAELQDVARVGTQLMSIYPLLMGAQALLRGVLIRGGCTSAVRAAMTANVAVSIATILAIVRLFSLNGVTAAALAVLAGTLVELAWLRWRRS